ncbi:hypothetical protein U9M48_039119 [Paspalum notatum var. saurae]|uniref:Uncharacterized protein n=1 Tax=Paspalum notatum var. saurae TaxID=547442 RepID=A0AAQ3UKQ6_PASNO
MASLSRVPTALHRHPHTRVHRRNPNRHPQCLLSSASCCSAIGAPLSNHATVPPSALGRLTALPPGRSAATALRHPSGLSPSIPARMPQLAPPPCPFSRPTPRHFGSATLTSPHHLLPMLAAPLRDPAHKPNLHLFPSSFGIVSVSSTILVTRGAKASKAAADKLDCAARSCFALTTLVHAATY